MNYTEIEIEGMKEILRDKEEYIKKLEIDKIHWRDLYWEECEKNKKLKESLDIATKCSSKEEDGIIRLSEENRLLKNELAWLKDHTKYNAITEEEYIDGTMTATEAKLRLQQSEDNKKYVSSLEEENKELEEKIRFLEQCLDNKEKVNKSMREELENIKEKLSQYEN